MALHRPKGNVMVTTRRCAWLTLAIGRRALAAKAVPGFRCAFGRHPIG
jgi:hypothetical protein